MKYSRWLTIMFAFCPTLGSEQVFEHHETVVESATASSFEQKLALASSDLIPLAERWSPA